MEIKGRKIGLGHPPYIIAEISANHNGDLQIAKQLIHEAANAGVDAVKIQTYRPDTITLESNDELFQINEGPWAGRSMFELYQEAHTPWEWHEELFECAEQNDITIFSSPFDFTAVDFLEQFSPPAYKIASFEITDIPLIKYVASKGKPMIISTGLANVDQIEEGLQSARDGGCDELALLHCVSGYPANPSDFNLLTIDDMQKRYGVIVGLSDHNLGTAVATASVVLGACIIEKHITFNRGGGGPDDSFSSLPSEFRILKEHAYTSWQARGTVNYDITESEQQNLRFQRSLFAVLDIEEGEKITTKNVKSIRPSDGLHTRYYADVLKKNAKIKIKRGTPIGWHLLTDI